MKNETHNKNNEVLTAYVDIDETICFYYNERIYELAIPHYDNIQKINKLYDEGWKIIYWTARGSSQINNIERINIIRKLTINQLFSWNAKYHELEIGDKKPLYDLIVDDKAKRIEEL